MNMDSESLQALSMVAYELGPFFFSILFTLVIVGIAHRCYRKVNLRKEPIASPEEKRSYRMYFISSFGAGILLVFISVAWWMYAHISKHTLQGAIIGLSSSQTLIAYSDELYVRVIKRPLTIGKEITDYHFAIVRDAPFNPGQRFSFLFYPELGYIGNKKPQPVVLDISYSGKDYEKFILSKNGENYTLKRNE